MIVLLMVLKYLLIILFVWCENIIWLYIYVYIDNVKVMMLKIFMFVML